MSPAATHRAHDLRRNRLTYSQRHRCCKTVKTHGIYLAISRYHHRLTYHCLRVFVGKFRTECACAQLNRTYDAHMFYFFFESRSLQASDPVVLWMTGDVSLLIWAVWPVLFGLTDNSIPLQVVQGVLQSWLFSMVSCCKILTPCIMYSSNPIKHFCDIQKTVLTISMMT